MSQKIAQVLLDFIGMGSMCGAEGDGAIDASTLQATLRICLSEMRGRLDEAAGIAKAAEACAEAGNIGKAVEIALDIEQLIYEVSTMLNAASMMHRIWKT